MTSISRRVATATAGLALLGLGSGCNNVGIERKDPPTKVELEARIKQVQNDPSMSEMAKKMTIGTLRSQENNGAPAPTPPTAKSTP